MTKLDKGHTIWSENQPSGYNQRLSALFLWELASHIPCCTFFPSIFTATRNLAQIRKTTLGSGYSFKHNNLLLVQFSKEYKWSRFLIFFSKMEWMRHLEPPGWRGVSKSRMLRSVAVQVAGWQPGAVAGPPSVCHLVQTTKIMLCTRMPGTWYWNSFLSEEQQRLSCFTSVI